jgi:glutamine---fructose-6-phosphate transaminase (isomerizing)
MCGIFGYIGKNDSSSRILEGLKRLEYRGYDSWGIAVVNDKNSQIEIFKKVGKIGDVKNVGSLPSSIIGIGHTRWATHGGVNDTNAHPHYSSDKSFVVAQNGIVENYQELKAQLMDFGYKFKTQTDTEVIVRLIEEKLKISKDLLDAVNSAFLELKGRNTIIVLPRSGDEIIAVRNGSPLVIGVDGDEYYFASDSLSFADKTNRVIFLEDNDLVHYKDGSIELYKIQTGEKKEIKIVELDQMNAFVDKEGYEHFMLKEIIEQQYTIREATQYSEEELMPIVEKIQNSEKIYTIGAGTAGFAAGQIAYYLRSIAGIFAQELKPYEIDSYMSLFSKNDLVIAISQSGETADTIEALEKMASKGVEIACVVNMQGSTITRMSKYQYLSRSGPEICVASTKAFTAQISFGFQLANAISGKYSTASNIIEDLSEELNKYFLKNEFEDVRKLVDEIASQQHFFVLGKGENFYVALEGALKVKEISYKHFEGFSSGELKHGVIALIEKGTPVFAIVSEDDYKQDVINAVAEVKARGAYVIGIGANSNELFDFHLRTVKSKQFQAVANTIPFQLLAYFMCNKLGFDPDKPRNLAKSVTVK